jgi:small subunit ribosomal protein S16
MLGKLPGECTGRMIDTTAPRESTREHCPLALAFARPHTPTKSDDSEARRRTVACSEDRRDMVKIRLMRMGMKGAPTYRIVVADARSPRDGRIIENIGSYNPRTEPSTIIVDQERAKHWLSVGAQPSESVASLLQRAGVLPPRVSATAEAPAKAKA